MELEKESLIFKTIQKYFDETSQENKDVRVTFDRKDVTFSETEFKNFTSVLKSLEYSETIGTEMLKVKSDDTFIHIHHVPSIVAYYHTNSHVQDTMAYREKTILSDNVNDIFDIDFNFSITENIPTDLPDTWNEEAKHFSLLQDIEYSKENVKYVAHMIKSSNDEFISMKESNVTKSNQCYGFSVVFSDMKSQTPESILQTVIRGMQLISMSSMLLSKAQQRDVLNQYHKLVKDDIEISGYNKKANNIPLLAPKPVTLELVNLVDPKTYGAVSILNEYTVTEKADGERVLMYINNIGRVYLINNTNNIEDTGMKVSKEGHNSLIDGEYVKCVKRKDNADKGLYAAFDIYYVNGKKVTDLPLMGEKSRIGHLQKFQSIITQSKDLEFMMKQHLYSKTILNDAKNILTNNSYPYEVDGLIFTPAKLALYSYYTNKAVQLTDNVKWDRVFKWKPSDQNTIDFLIKENKTIKKNGNRLTEFGLYVGYTASQWENIDVIKGLRMRYDKSFQNQKSRNIYVPILFKPSIYDTPGVEFTHIKQNSSGELRAENGDKIESDTIVEFKYIDDPNIPVSERWVPLRTREDKTRLYKKNILSKTLNEMGVALNVWRSIHNPVTQGMIMGNETIENNQAAVDKMLQSDDVYYSRNINRKYLLSVNMMDFHNLGVKELLYGYEKNKKNKLLELCCGEAGDMSRWLNNGYKFVLGVDLVSKNIYNPKSGCYHRMLQSRRNHMNKFRDVNPPVYFPDYIFAAGDCAYPLKTGEASNNENIKDVESENILKIVLNNKRKTSDKVYIRRIEEKGARGFDVVSCMFSIHYFFQSEAKLDGFLNNVSENLNENGRFICTFMDGNSIDNALDKGDGITEGKKLYSEYKNGLPVWAIIRKYGKETVDPYGKQINVFIENTQKLIPEYLVSFETLIVKAKEHGLEILDTEMFSKTFEKLKNKNEDNSPILANAITEMDKDDVLKQFSFFNRWAVFQKTKE
jgi:hypothetical protein